MVLAMVSFGGRLLYKKMSATKTQPQATRVLETVTLDSVSQWEPIVLSDIEKKAGIIARQKKSQPEATLIFRKIPGKLDDKVDINKLPDEIVASFTKTLTNFTLIDKKVVDVGGFQTVLIHYKMTGSKEGTLENEIFVIPTANQTFYLTYGAKEADFAQLEGDINTLNDSFIKQVR